MEKKKPTHRKHNRWHDYRGRCIYHITLVVSDRCKVLGRIIDARDKGLDLKKVSLPNGKVQYVAQDGAVWSEAQLAETAEVAFTPLGLDIQRKIQEIPLAESKRGNDVQILGACVMPEHIHFLLYIRQPMAQNVGMVLLGFKQGCNKLLKRYLGIADAFPSLEESSPSLSRESPTDSWSRRGASASPLGSVAFSKQPTPATFLQGASRRILEEHALFEDDFDETRLRRKGQLRAMIDYVHNNPAHRWLRAHKPHWLLPIRGIEIAGRRYDAIGNILLLGLPRFQVHCRYRWERDHDAEARRAHQNESVIKPDNAVFWSRLSSVRTRRLCAIFACRRDTPSSNSPIMASATIRNARVDCMTAATADRCCSWCRASCPILTARAVSRGQSAMPSMPERQR